MILLEIGISRKKLSAFLMCFSTLSIYLYCNHDDSQIRLRFSKTVEGCFLQSCSPRGRPWLRGHILKSLALASKPQVLENCPVLGSRTALFFESLKFCWKTLEIPRKICEDLFCFSQLEIA